MLQQALAMKGQTQAGASHHWESQELHPECPEPGLAEWGRAQGKAAEASPGGRTGAGKAFWRK